MAHSTRLQPAPLTAVRLEGGFWGHRQELNRTATLQAEYAQLVSTGRLDSLRQTWQPGDPNEPHIFWDSDVEKWAEAAAYSLTLHPDPALEAQVDEIVDLIAAGQQPDGYFNTHFTVVEPQNRWRNLRDQHELYQAGNLFEFAVAYYRATGKTKILDVARKYADYIASVFGRGEGQKRGYPGHEEIELALFKLYGATGERRYRNLAAYFIEERGQQPHYYDAEARARGEDPTRWWGMSYDYSQCHVPVRQQKDAVGHAVRATYLYSGMADLAADTGDEELYTVLRGLWHSATQRRMYLTGGIGSSASLERFSYDFDLPNEAAYAETCAAIGLVFWAQRMLQIERRGEYGDAMERALYNGILSGISLDGTRFFYENPLAMHPDDYRLRPFLRGNTAERVQRQPWFTCACCPPNIARLFASLGQYVYAQGEDEIAAHLYTPGCATLEAGGAQVVLTQETRYPWEGAIRLAVQPEREARFTLALRVPGWCRHAKVAVNGIEQPLDVVTGYARLVRTWRPGDVVTLDLAMPAERIEANPAVWANGGRVALQRGPVIYCVEEIDNGAALSDLVLPRATELAARWAPDLLGGVMVIEGQGLRRDAAAFGDALYRAGTTPLVAAPIRAIPYYAWNNRGVGEMLVWLLQV